MVIFVWEVGARTNVCSSGKGWREVLIGGSKRQEQVNFGVMTDQQIGNIRKESDAGRE